MAPYQERERDCGAAVLFFIYRIKTHNNKNKGFFGPKRGGKRGGRLAARPLSLSLSLFIIFAGRGFTGVCPGTILAASCCARTTHGRSFSFVGALAVALFSRDACVDFLLQFFFHSSNESWHAVSRDGARAYPSVGRETKGTWHARVHSRKTNKRICRAHATAAMFAHEARSVCRARLARERERRGASP
nr:hypothetical protein [Pandoravirus aubagnensis]